jgi:predicted phage-related endonuclease
MKMTERITHDLRQGSDEWAQFRLTHFGASEAAAMIGISPKVKRNELLHMKHTCMPKEFSDWVQEHILDKGHEVEALARPYIEAMLGEDLYPVTMSIGDISASCDGLTMDERTAWEHKQWNAALAESLRRGELPEEFMPQCQQVLMVTGAERLIFTCSDGTDDNMVNLEVRPNQAWFDNIIDGWAQFRKDLAEYAPREIPETPKADAIMALPALAVQIRGEVIASNLPAFKAAAEKFIGGIKTDLKTDEDFVQADATVKFCKDAEDSLEIAKNAAIAQTASIDELMRTVDHIREQLRSKRLALDKLVKSRKEQIKEAAVAERRQKYAEHVAGLNAELGSVQINVPAPDFAAAIKSLKTIASLHNALDTALANGKIVADAAAKDLRAKLDWYKPHAEYTFLFRDLQALIQKPREDFELAATARIAEHKRQEDEKAKTKPVETSVPVVAQVAQPATRIGTARTAPPSVPTLRLGQINELLAPISLSAEGLATLGIKHSATDKNAKLYHEADFERICEALTRHIAAALQQQAA